MNRFTKYRVVMDPLVAVFTAVLAYWVGFLLRFDFSFSAEDRQIFFYTLPIAVLSKVLFSQVFSIHRRSWRYVSLVDVVDSMKAASAGSALFAAVIFLLGNGSVPRAVYLLDWFLFPTFLMC